MLFGCSITNFGKLSRGQPRLPNFNHCFSISFLPKSHQFQVFSTCRSSEMENTLTRCLSLYIYQFRPEGHQFQSGGLVAAQSSKDRVCFVQIASINLKVGIEIKHSQVLLIRPKSYFHTKKAFCTRKKFCRGERVLFGDLSLHRSKSFVTSMNLFFTVMFLATLLQIYLYNILL